MKIGNAIKNRRKELNMSVDELAQAIGKNRSTIYRYESGDIENIPTELLLQIAKALQTTPKQLILPRKKWRMGFDENGNAPVFEAPEEWFSDRAQRWYDATDGFHFSDREILTLYEAAKYIIQIQNYDDYDERMEFLSALFKQLNK